jgi:hypothetical protein
VLAHALEVELHRFANKLLYFIQCCTGDSKPRKIRRVRPPTCGRLLVDNQIFHFSPACLRILFNVPGGKSTDGCPATVTVPGFAG